MKSNTPIRLALALAVALMATGVAAAMEQARADADSTFTREISAAGRNTLAVETVNGSIVATGTEGESVAMEVEMVVRGPKREVCRELISKMEIQMDEEGAEISIKPKLQKKSGYSQTVSFTLKLPARMSLEAETVNGGIDMTGLSGSVEMNSINGGLLGDNLTGGVSAETINGAVQLQDIGGDVDVETVNGAVNLNCSEPVPGKIDIETVNGAVTVRLPAAVNAKLQGECGNGGITLKLPGGETAREKRHLERVLGAGGGEYDFETVNGAITIIVGGG